MNEEFIKQCLAEIIAANEQALGLVVAAIAKQTDAKQLLTDLQQQIAAAKVSKQIHPQAIRQATSAMAAVQAEVMLRQAEAQTKKH